MGALHESSSGIVDFSGVAAVTHATTAPVVEYTVPVSAVQAATAPVDELCTLRWYLRHSHVLLSRMSTMKPYREAEKSNSNHVNN